MIVLGIDPGTNCGWAVRLNDGSFLSGVWNLRGGRFEGGGMRFLRARQFFTDILTRVKPDKVAFEEVRRHMGVDAAHVYGGIVAVISSVCEELKVPYEGVPVSAAKTFATGKGNADKDAMMAAARLRWSPWEPSDDNEADARFIAEVGFHGVPAPKVKARKKKAAALTTTGGVPAPP